MIFQPRLPRLLCQMLLACEAALTRPSPASREPCHGQSPWTILLEGFSAISLLLIGDALDGLGLDLRAGQRGQKQPGENGDDGDDDQKFDKSERKIVSGRHTPTLQERISTLK